MSLQTTINWCGRCGAREPTCVVPVCFWGCLGSFGVACFVWDCDFGSPPQVDTAVWLYPYKLLLRRSKFQVQRAREEGRPMLLRLLAERLWLSGVTGAATLSRD